MCLDLPDNGCEMLASESRTESEGYFTDAGSCDEATDTGLDGSDEENLVLTFPPVLTMKSEFSDSDYSISSSSSEPVSLNICIPLALMGFNWIMH